jgi:2-dehydro-3-deoxyphosphogluconate aldolase/(4S)-4-hydroxy-2-oxoglutarate aldolase
VTAAEERTRDHDPAFLAALREDRLAAVIRARGVADAAGLVESLSAAGVRCVEFTFTTAGAVDAIRASSEVPGAVVGAGTVLSAEQCSAAIEAGARFVVAPSLALDIVRPCREAGVPFVLGAWTPSEVVAAVAAGSAAVKLFPAGIGGPGYLKSLRGPFPDTDFVPSGGVSRDNAREFLAAGALAVFAGSELVPPDAVVSGDSAEVARRAREFRSALDGEATG